MKVWKKGEGMFRVASESNAETFYRVREVKGIFVCTCPHFTQRQVETCKHIQKVKEVQESGDYIDSTELRQLKNQLIRLHLTIDDLKQKIEAIEEGWKPSSESFPPPCEHCQSRDFELTGIIKNSKTGNEEHVFTCLNCHKKTKTFPKEAVFFTPLGFCACGNKIADDSLEVCDECR